MNNIPTDKHVFVCGMTGSGKSYLCESYLRCYDYVVKLDTKNETEERYREGRSPWEGLKEGRDFTVVYNFDDLDGVETDKIIYVPPYDEQNEETFNKFFRWIFERENTILWVDELMSIAPNAQRTPREFGRLLQQGRSKGCGVWCGSQRPSAIPAIVPANCHYFFIFKLNLPQDNKKMVEITGMPQIWDAKNPLQGYQFWYYKVGDKYPVKAEIERG